MKKYLNFTTNCGPLVFKLLDTGFANFWVEHFLNIQKNYNLQPYKTQWPYVKERDSSADEIIDTIIRVFNDINQIDYIVPFPEPINRSTLEKLDLDAQAFLNRLHRYLVTATERRDRWIDDAPQFNWIPWEDQEIHHLFNLLNQTIHKLEEYVVTPHRKQFHYFITSLEVTPVASQYTDCTVYEDGVDKEISDSFMKDLRLSGHDVWIKKDILGKDFVTAFADHDDPKKSDVRSPPMISGGFLISADDARKKFFETAEFKNWLGFEPTDAQGSYPIGDIVTKPKNITEITELRFIDIS